MTKDLSVRRPSRPWYRPSLTTQIMIGLIVGVAVGWIRPEWGNNVYFLRDIFLNLIKSIIGPLVFSTLVVGIAGGGDLRHGAAGGSDGFAPAGRAEPLGTGASMMQRPPIRSASPAAAALFRVGTRFPS